MLSHLLGAFMYRNKKLLQAARGQACQYCGMEDGTVVAAHSNQLRDGRGHAFKSSDYRVAYLCIKCHDLVDGRSGNLNKQQKIDIWEEAHRKTIGLIFELGLVK